jgi:hypothetical protein
MGSASLPEFPLLQTRDGTHQTLSKPYPRRLWPRGADHVWTLDEIPGLLD